MLIDFPLIQLVRSIISKSFWQGFFELITVKPAILLWYDGQPMCICELIVNLNMSRLVGIFSFGTFFSISWTKITCCKYKWTFSSLEKVAWSLHRFHIASANGAIDKLSSIGQTLGAKTHIKCYHIDILEGIICWPLTFSIKVQETQT
jgi:hypothetical protein